MRGKRSPKKDETGLAAPAGVRCGIYTRKSTDEGLDQAFNTLDAQREAAESFINSQRQEGWVALPQKYDDGGYTGANMDRPALKRLLADIQSGAVNCVARCTRWTGFRDHFSISRGSWRSSISTARPLCR